MKYLITILFLITFCKSNGQTIGFPKIISVLKSKAIQIEFNESQQWFRKVKYIGQKRDTILLSEDTYSVVEENKIPFDTYRRLYKYNFECKNCINIRVDTNQILALSYVEWKRNKIVEIYYKSYPVIIENKSDSLYKIGLGQNVGIIAEALDVDNVWKPIEIPYMYKCGTGLEDLYLQGHQIACVLIPKYKGNFRTKLRLKLNNNISAPFMASISRQQFKKSVAKF